MPLPSATRRALRLTALLLVPLALAACTDPVRLGGAGSGALSQPDSGAQGSVGDPTSVAYFNATVGDRVLFLVDQSTLTAQAETVLAAQAAWLADNPDYSALIEGHADEQGTREYNLALGARRAAAVQNYLIAQGVAPNRLSTVTYGKERPIEICSEESCYAANRRAVTVLRPASGLGA